MMISLLLFVVAASPAYGVGYETEPSFIERSVKRKILLLTLSIILHKSEYFYDEFLCSEHLHHRHKNRIGTNMQNSFKRCEEGFNDNSHTPIQYFGLVFK